MNELDFAENIIEEPEIDFEPFYNQHFIETDASGNIIRGWSDAFAPATENAICINEQGGYQFRLWPEGEENPNLFTMDGIPLYKWDGQQVIARDEVEIEAERAPSLVDVQAFKLTELSAACNQAIIAGCDVELSAASGHISLTAEDQINLTAALNAVEQGAATYPYHLDGQLCKAFSAEDIRLLAKNAANYKLYHTTYYNHLAAWVRRCETLAEVQAINYGVELPIDLTDNMAEILGGVEKNAV